MKRLSGIALTVVVAAAGCGGGGIESQVQSQYGDYATEHHFDAKAKNVGTVTCTHEATNDVDGWCKVRPKGFHLTLDVPYKGDKVLWGDAGLSKAPS